MKNFETLPLSFDSPPIFAVGGELKSAFCLMQGRQALVSPQFGDMQNLECLHAFETAYQQISQQFRFEPQAIACDMHPNYLSTRWAQNFSQKHSLPLFYVQHHHAHVAAVMAEHGVDETVLGISFDGTGYGTDGAIWGGEILKANYSGFERLAHLAYVPLAGGDISIRKPYRMALAHLWAAGIDWEEDLPPVQACGAKEREILWKQLERSINTVPTSSMGRLFDAVSALIGLREEVSFEAQAAIELQALVVPSDCHYCFEYKQGLIDPKPLLKAIIDDMRAGISQAVIAGRFHQAVVELVLEMVNKYPHPLIALSGGVFQNQYLKVLLQKYFLEQGHCALFHEKVPTTDAGLALGQAAILAHRF